MTKDVRKAYQLAKKARGAAHAPYSQFHVGACFKVRGKDSYFTGCNIENASFGATVCAERVGIWNWASQTASKTKLEFLVLVTDTTDPVATPCGMCLQVMSEFVGPDFPIYVANLKGIQREAVLKDFLPSAFEFPARTMSTVRASRARTNNIY